MQIQPTLKNMKCLPYSLNNTLTCVTELATVRVLTKFSVAERQSTLAGSDIMESLFCSDYFDFSKYEDAVAHATCLCFSAQCTAWS